MSKNILNNLVKEIISKQKAKPFIVAISGVDGAGKTYFTKKLIKKLKDKHQNIIDVSIDGFHNSEEIRYQKGRNSAEDFYKDSYNYDKLKEVLLNPIINQEKKYKTAYFDCSKNREVVVQPEKIYQNTILIIEGIFLFRPELLNYWDYKIFLDVDFKTSLERNVKRANEIDKFGSAIKIIEKYNQRYMPGQKIYFQDANPKEVADIVIDNNDFENPFIVKKVGFIY